MGQCDYIIVGTGSPALACPRRSGYSFASVQSIALTERRQSHTILSCAVIHTRCARNTAVAGVSFPAQIGPQVPRRTNREEPARFLLPFQGIPRASLVEALGAVRSLSRVASWQSTLNLRDLPLNLGNALLSNFSRDNEFYAVPSLDIRRQRR